jgi:DNA-binding NarL/FixJ family response regulator
MYNEVPLVVLSAMPAGEAEETCIEAGADLYIEKSTGANEISAAIQGLFVADAATDEEAPGDTKLSKRQKQLILMLDRGLSNRDIATELNISEHTVKVHLWRLFRRLGVKSRTQTLHFARTHGLLMG